MVEFEERGHVVSHTALRKLLRLAVLSLAAGRVLAADEIHWTIIGQSAVSFDWRGPNSENVIRYGLSSGNLTSSATAITPSPLPNSSPGPFWEARLTGLQANTTYWYQIGSATESTFRTPPPRGSSDYWIAAEADLGIGADNSAHTVPIIQQQIASDNVNLPGDDRPRFVLAAGDLTYGDSHGAAVVDTHFNEVMVWSKGSAYMPGWGNHEDGGVTDDRQNYEGRFDLPNSQDVPVPPPAGGPADEWMWWDYGNVRYLTYPEPFSGAWADWQAKADVIMAAAQNDAAINFIITYGHRPPFSSGADHGSESIASNIRALHAKYSKYVLNIAGHSHHYERSDPSQSDGVVEIVTGGGGYYLGGLASPQPSWSAFRMNRLQHTRLHVLPDRIEIYAICGPKGADGTAEEIVCPRGAASDQPGAVFDQVTIRTTAGDPPPSAPMGLVRTDRH